MLRPSKAILIIPWEHYWRGSLHLGTFLRAPQLKPCQLEDRFLNRNVVSLGLNHKARLNGVFYNAHASKGL